MAIRDRARLGVALLIGAALAFPAGMMVAGRQSDPEARAVAGARPHAAVRDVFSPSVRSDPYFIERQREGIEALERYCAQTGESCPQARAARRRLDDLAR